MRREEGELQSMHNIESIVPLSPCSHMMKILIDVCFNFFQMT